MRVLPLAEVKARLSELVVDVSRRDEEITITKNGREAAVLVSYDEFESWKETVAIMSNPELIASVRQGIREVERGKARQFRSEDLDRLFGPAK